VVKGRAGLGGNQCPGERTAGAHCRMHSEGPLPHWVDQRTGDATLRGQLIASPSKNGAEVRDKIDIPCGRFALIIQGKIERIQKLALHAKKFCAEA